MSERSELVILVETERRLDDSIANARQSADATREAARLRARTAAADLDRQIAREHFGIAAAVAAETEARLHAISDAARAAVVRYEQADIAAIARALARRVVAIAEEES